MQRASPPSPSPPPPFTTSSRWRSPPPPSPSPPPPRPLDSNGAALSCRDLFRSAYDREACVENVEMLPIDLFAGGAVMLLLVLPHVLFFLGLCAKRWKRHAGRKGSACPFTGAPAHNRCRACGTFVGDRAFHRTCSLTTQQSNGNGTVTVTTTTATGWDHCVGCQFLKGHALMVLFLLAMFGAWAYTVVERTLAVTGVTHRDERVRTFNITLYMLTAILGLISWAVVWCTRRTLLKFTCLTPCGGCCGASPAVTMAVTPTADATAPAPPAARVTAAAAMPPSEVVVVQGVPVCGSV